MEKINILYIPKEFWLSLQIFILIFLFFIFSKFQKQKMNFSNFKKREFENEKKAFFKNESKFFLTGFQPNLPDHLILGVEQNADTQEIQKSYRNLMKIYHPDKIGSPDSQQWKDAQVIAQRITQAKNNLISLRSKKI